MAREKKPPVLPEKRRDWLERSERGESPPKIAKDDGFDARTVRKHIDIGRQERETKEARASVLRNALERHYEDLCHYAEKLISTGDITEFNISVKMASLSVPYEQQLGIALRQHLPRSPIWGYINQRTKLYQMQTELTKEFENKLESDISSDPGLQAELTQEESGVIPGMVSAFKHQSQQWLHGSKGLDPDTNLKSEPAESEFVNLSYGAFPMGKVRNEHVEFIRASLKGWIARIKEWEEFCKLEKNYRELKRVEENLKDEVAVIALRRVVPGRCRYCPL